MKLTITTCPTCQGSGTVIQDPCLKCHGVGRVLIKKKLALRIPAGVDTGSRLRLHGEGEQGDPGAPAGDLYVFIHVEPHETFRRQNQELRLQAMQAGETTRENIRLRQLVDWKQKVPWKLKLARVIARDPANWWRTVQIDRGSLDGLRENLPVLTPDGLIGRVSAVGMTSARVVLIGDPNCKVPATILGETAESGIIASAGLFDGSFVNLTYLANRANLKPGQSVVTSGLSAIYPKGIPIGTVADARSVESGLYTEAQVKLAAKLNALEEVWVLFP